jgi:uncharacterized membrane protein YeiH
MVLAGGAVAKNIVWVVTGAISGNAGGHLEGVLLGKTSLALPTGVTANIRLLAQTAVTLEKVRTPRSNFNLMFKFILLRRLL